MTENETEKYSNLLGGRLPCSDLEFELCDRLIDLEKRVESLSKGCIFDGNDGCTMDGFKCLAHTRKDGRGVWLKKLN